jgi:hypothetical protein
MAPFELVATSSLGSLLGVQHALEPDHLAAVSTLVTGEKGTARAAWLGACWGFGHMLTLMAAGASLVLLRVEMPAWADAAFELAVAALLIAFGVRAIRLSRLAAAPVATDRPLALARRPLLVGAVHGLAGSGALTAMVIAALPTTGARLTYLALFGVGSVIGMATLSGVLGWPLARVGTRRDFARILSATIGAVSTLLGLYWGYPLVTRLLA